MLHSDDRPATNNTPHMQPPHVVADNSGSHTHLSFCCVCRELIMQIWGNQAAVWRARAIQVGRRRLRHL